MNLLRVVNWGTLNHQDVFVGIKGEGGRDSRLEMSRDDALQLILALRRAVSELPGPVVSQERAVIEVARCVEMVDAGRRIGLVLETSEGLELPLALDRAAVDSLTCWLRGDRVSRSAH